MEKPVLTQPTIEHLRSLRLPGLAKAWQAQQQQPDIQSLSFDERLSLLIEAEVMRRDNNRLSHMLKDAKLKQSQACIEDIQYSAARGLEKATLRQLATCRWVLEKCNILITGMTGTGKTYLACALAQAAIRQGHRCLYKKASRLADEFTIARADGSFPSFIAKLSKVPVLIIDDWGLTPVTEPERRDLLELFDERHGHRATLMTSQIPVEQWHQHFGEPTVADAICDRLLHSSHRIELKGPSLRKEKISHT